LAGFQRDAKHLADAAMLVWGWGLVAVAIAVLLHGRPRARWAAVPYLLSLAVLILGYPALRYHPLAVALLAIHVAQVVALGLVVVAWLRWRTPSVQPGRTQALVVVLAALHLALTLPMVLMAMPLPPVLPGMPTPNPFASWWMAQGQYGAIYVAIILASLLPSWKGRGGEQENGKANGGGNGAGSGVR